MNPEAQLKSQLKEGLTTLKIEFTDNQLDRILQYQSLLLKWNKVTNLTAITRPTEVISHHLLDALAINPWFSGRTVLDVGSGGGLPGIPLALVNPDKDFILLDPNGKKARFMTQARIELGLNNVDVVQSRVEDHEGAYDHVVSRAFRQVAGFVDSCEHVLKPGGTLLAMKGPDYVGELEGLDENRGQLNVHRIQVPGLSAERYLLEISR